MNRITEAESKLPAPPADLSERIKHFRIDVPEYFNFAYDVMDAWAAREPGKLAMIWVNQHGDERKLTFGDFSRLSIQAANLLFKYGIRKGDRVVLMLPRLPEWWIFSLALIRLGAVQCHIPTLSTASDLKIRLGIGGFKMIVSDVTNAEKIDSIAGQSPFLTGKILVDGSRPGWISYPEETAGAVHLPFPKMMTDYPLRTKSSDPMLLLFTSGTSKFPKLVEHTYSYPLGHRITAELWHGLSCNDLHYTTSDTGWGKNLWGNYFGQWMVGACVFIFDIRGKFDPAQIPPLMERYGITSFCAPPTIYRMLVLLDLRQFNLRSLKQCTSAGEPLHTETWRLWKEGTGLSIREGYGQTETICCICNSAGTEPRPGSMGKPTPGWNIELLDERNHPVPPGQEGRIAVNLSKGRPVGFFRQYLADEKVNQEAFVGDFYLTGDKARVDADGYFWYLGRSDEIIKSSGYRISPQEVEEALMLHPAVQEVAVVGKTDPLRGKKVKAYVVLKNGFDADETMVQELQTHAKRVTAPYKYPREIEFVSSLPKTFSGKIKRDTLRQAAETGKICW